jgi:ABC-type branched-subunit amino acid transport system ATPase component
MIDRIEIQGYKTHEHTKIALGRFTLLAGPNGIGKTTVLRAILALPTKLEIYPPKAPRTNWIFSAHIDEKESWTAYVSGESDEDRSWKLDKDRRSEDEDDFPPFMPPKPIIGIYYFKPSISNLPEPSYSEEIPPQLSSDGKGLASLLAFLMTSAPVDFSAIESALKKIVPQVIGIRATRTRIEVSERQSIKVKNKEVAYDESREVTGDALLFDMTTGTSIPADEISDGTLVTLALLTAIHQDPKPRILLLDDIETGLHPSAQKTLMDQLRAILAQDPELQIVATTHSPYIIDQCAPEEVWLLAPDADGYCQCKCLADHPKAKEALQILSTGEFWSAEGEDWVLDPPEKSEPAKGRKPKPIAAADAH